MVRVRVREMADRQQHIVVSPKLMKGMSPARARALGISEDERLAAVVQYASPPMVEPQPQPCTKEVSGLHISHPSY